MLKKSFRLKEKEDFDRVFREGKPLFFGAFGCKIAKNSLPHLRLGFSFSKKHLPLAVERNRARRILSEALATEEWEKVREQGVDIVFFSLKKGKKINLEEFQNRGSEVAKAITKL